MAKGGFDMMAMMEMFQKMAGKGGGNPMMAMMAGGGGGKAWGKGSGGGRSGGPRDNSKLCWVGNIPEGLSEEELSENFKQAGTVKKAFFMKGNSAGVEYSSAEEVQQAITMFNGAEVDE